MLCHGDLDESRGGVLIFEDTHGAPEPVLGLRSVRKLALWMKIRKLVPVADTSQLTSGVAERYASSLFELALEHGAVDSGRRPRPVPGDARRKRRPEALDLEPGFLRPTTSSKAIIAISEKAGISGFVANFLKVVAAIAAFSPCRA